MMTPLPGATTTKPGSATVPFFGVKPVLVDKKGKEVKGPGEGRLCIDQSWPGQMRTVYGDHQRFIDTYFSTYQNIISQATAVKEIMMVFIELLVELMTLLMFLVTEWERQK